MITKVNTIIVKLGFAIVNGVITGLQHILEFPPAVIDFSFLMISYLTSLAPT